jgi:hypothetical protein
MELQAKLTGIPYTKEVPKAMTSAILKERLVKKHIEKTQ